MMRRPAGVARVPRGSNNLPTLLEETLADERAKTTSVPTYIQMCDGPEEEFGITKLERQLCRVMKDVWTHSCYNLQLGFRFGQGSNRWTPTTTRQRHVEIVFWRCTK